MSYTRAMSIAKSLSINVLSADVIPIVADYSGKKVMMGLYIFILIRLFQAELSVKTARLDIFLEARIASVLKKIMYMVLVIHGR